MLTDGFLMLIHTISAISHRKFGQMLLIFYPSVVEGITHNIGT